MRGRNCFGFCVAGWAGQSTISPLQQTWLLKVDSNGCFGSNNCPQNYITGIPATNSANVSLTVYPNPTNSILNIDDEKKQFQNATIEIKNYLGQVVLSSPFNSQINLQNLSAGMYFLTVKDKDYLKTVKIIKE